jgi:hypothetical protein
MHARQYRIRTFLLPLLFPALALSFNLFRAAPGAQIALASGDDSKHERVLRYAVFGDSWASGINFGPPSQEYALVLLDDFIWLANTLQESNTTIPTAKKSDDVVV